MKVALSFRHKKDRQSREDRLILTREMPAKKVDKYLQQIETGAALKIQTQWRGFQTKRHFQHQRAAMRRLKAVLTIQR